MLGNASLTSAAVLASQGRSNHARNTKVGLVKLPLRKQLIDNSLLLRNAIHLGHEAGIVSHAGNVEIRCEAVKDGKDDVEEQVAVALGRSQSCRKENCRQPVDSNQEQSGSKDASKPGLLLIRDEPQDESEQRTVL